MWWFVCRACKVLNSEKLLAWRRSLPARAKNVTRTLPFHRTVVSSNANDHRNAVCPRSPATEVARARFGATKISITTAKGRCIHRHIRVANHLDCRVISLEAARLERDLLNKATNPTLISAFKILLIGNFRWAWHLNVVCWNRVSWSTVFQKQLVDRIKSSDIYMNLYVKVQAIQEWSFESVRSLLLVFVFKTF